MVDGMDRLGAIIVLRSPERDARVRAQQGQDQTWLAFQGSV